MRGFDRARKRVRSRIRAQTRKRPSGSRPAAIGCSACGRPTGSASPPAKPPKIYAKRVVAADFEAPGDDDVIEKVRSDLAAKGVIQIPRRSCEPSSAAPPSKPARLVVKPLHHERRRARRTSS